MTEFHLDRKTPCPSCGAPIVFRFAGARAVVCSHCRFVVARTDQNLVAVGRMADLIAMPSPFQVGDLGQFRGESFVVEGRVQLDRVGQSSAPWQEFFIAFPNSNRWMWFAIAQGRYYATSEVEFPIQAFPPLATLRPGGNVSLGHYGSFTIAEIGTRRVVSGEGELPHVANPGVPTHYVDFYGPNGSFGTLDYGDGKSIGPKLYLGGQFDPAQLIIRPQSERQSPEVAVAALACPNCGGNLPLINPSGVERIVCRYCGMTSDFEKGALRALKQAPRPPMQPIIPIGTEGTIEGRRLICCGFLIRGCVVEGEHYGWREYLLYGGQAHGYFWLMEEDGTWHFVLPMSPGDVKLAGSSIEYNGNKLYLKQPVNAVTEFVLGEFYWKIEVGERVRASEYSLGRDKISVEEGGNEVNVSYCKWVAPAAVRDGFRIQIPLALPTGSDSNLINVGRIILIIFLIFILIYFQSLGHCGGGGGGFISSPGYGGPSFGGK